MNVGLLISIDLVASVSMPIFFPRVMSWCEWPRIVTQRILCNDAYISFSMFHLFPDITALLLSFGCHICLYALTRVWYMQQSLLCTKKVIYTFVCYSMEYARLLMQQLSWTSSAKLWRANGLHDKSQWSRHGAECNSSISPIYWTISVSVCIWTNTYLTDCGSQINTCKRDSWNNTHCL